MPHLRPAIRESQPRNCRDAIDPYTNPKRAALSRRCEGRSAGKPSGRDKGAMPRPSRIRRVGEFHEARVAPSALRCPERAETELSGAGVSLSAKTGSGE